MDERTFNELIARTWRQLSDGLDEIDPDDCDVVETGDMITLAFANGRKCVINTQRAAWQVWVAARTEGVHFDWDGARWMDDRGRGIELTAFVADAVERELGERPSF